MRRSLLLVLPLLAALLATARGEEPKPRKKKVKLDYAYYEAYVAPIVQGICTECHADPTRTLGRHRLRPPLGTEIKAKHVRQNFKVASKLIKPGKPHRSPWILKPLGPHQGGLEHGGGQRIAKDSAEHKAMLEFVNGAKYRSTVVPEIEPPKPPPIPVHALTGDAESQFGPAAFAREGDVGVGAGADGAALLRPGARGGVAALHLDADETRLYSLALLVRGPGAGYGWRIDDEPWRVLADVPEGERRVASDVVSDGTGPLHAPTGTLRVVDGRLAMEGTSQAPAAWLGATRPAFETLRARVSPPPDPGGRVDALLLFGMADVNDGYFVGLLDGCTSFAIGRLERGRPVVHASVHAPRVADGAVRRLGVVRTEDGVRGLLDGEALVYVRVEESLVGRPFGLLTHGALLVDRLTAEAAGEAEPVYDARFEARPAVEIRAGRHVIHVALPAGAPALRALILEPSPPREDE